MDPFQTRVPMDATPPGSPDGIRSMGVTRSPQSLMGSPYSMNSLSRSPQLRSPRVASPQLRSPSYFRADDDLEQGDGLEQETRAPRLVIRKLVLINYKSYAGRQEVGPFNENFTAVVGPNGSGKSNVIDSLLFVFGFRAKKMRQDKLTGLIHKSEKHPALQFARVEVHFETVGIPGSELVLAREVRRDGNNFYSVNDKRCTYGEVSELLEERGIDLRHKRFLILQGEVESIALMPAKAENDGDDGLLEYLEDIIGTSSYKSRIEELEVESEVLRQDCDEKQRRIDIVFKDLKKLDTERAEIERFMVSQNRGAVARSSLWQLQASRIANTIKLLGEDLEEQRAEISTLRNQMTEKRERLTQLEDQVISDNKLANDRKQELKDVTKRLKEAQLQQVKAKQRVDQLSAKNKKAERNLTHARTEHKSATIWLENFSKDNQALNTRLKELVLSEAEERKKLEQIQAELHESTKDLHNELESLQIQAEPWREKITAKQQELKVIDAEYAEIRQQVEEAQGKEKTCRVDAEKVIEEGHTVQKRVKTLTKYRDKLLDEQRDIEKKITESTQTKESTAQELEQLRPEVAAAQEVKTSSQNRNRLESELLRLNIPGLYGRLGSLGSIDEKYDIAVSTAGPELNNFVVDTVDTAKKCIEELRKRSIGRAKFMVLSKLKPVSSDGKQLPATRLLDLIKPVEPLFMKAFASILGDTMVVPTPEEATRVAFGGPRRHKVVTLGGMLVNSSGQMGGGGTPSRGLMAKNVSVIGSEELESMEKRLAALELDFVEAKEHHRGLLARLEESKTELPKVELELEKERMSLKELEGQMNQIRDTRRQLQAEVKSWEQKETEFSEQHKVSTAKIVAEKESLEGKSKPIESQIQKLQEQILEAGGLRLRQQSVKVSDLEKEEVEIQRRIEEGHEKVAQETSRVSKLEAEIEKYQKEVEDCSNSDVSHQDIPDLSELEMLSQRLSANLDNHLNSVDAAKTESNGVRSEIEELRAAEIEVKNRLDQMQHGWQENTKKRDEIQNKLSSLKLHDVSVARSLDTGDSSPANLVLEQPDADEMTDDTNINSTPASTAVEARPEIQVEEHVLTELSPDELEGLNEGELKATIAASDEASKGGKVDAETINRYRQRFNEYLERKAVGDQAIQTYQGVKDEVQRLKKKRYNEFMEGFLQISSKLKEMYQLITMGGNAELELVDTMDPFAEGILFSVMPPKKSWRNIANLSGGEKTLSSLALVFALHHYKPTPLYVMDEIDAALDFRNVSIIANYIKERTKDGQFIVISLRNNMFELASRLVGVYKVENMTRSVTLQTE